MRQKLAKANVANVAKVGRARTLFRYLRDPRAPKLGKVLLVLAAAYVIMPADLIPDVPIVGWLDDIGVMGLAVAWASRIAARYQERLAAEEAEPVAAAELEPARP